MKTCKQTLSLFILFLMVFHLPSTIAQEKDKRPEYIVVTKMHWNMHQKDFDMKKWKSVEKEYLDKVTSKNEYIVGASFYLHLFTADNTELLYVQSYASWEDIDKAAEKNEALTKKAWPNEDARKAFFKNRFSYYANKHSDEIYATVSGAKLMSEKPEKEMVLYVKKSHFSFPEDGTKDAFNNLRKEYFDKVINKNSLIKAYYPSVHAWGADRTEFIEAYFIDSLADLDKMFNQEDELAKKAWPNESTRKDYAKKYRNYFTGVHGDFLYSSIPELSK